MKKFRQSRHVRHSKKGKKFVAGKGLKKELKKLDNKQYKKLLKDVAPFSDADGDGVQNINDDKPFDEDEA